MNLGCLNLSCHWKEEAETPNFQLIMAHGRTLAIRSGSLELLMLPALDRPRWCRSPGQGAREWGLWLHVQQAFCHLDRRTGTTEL